MVIKEYESKYLDDVINLFVEEYKVDFEAYKQIFLKFFEHPFQNDKCIRILAVDEGERLMGFQSFFYWPYKKDGKSYTVYQSGSSIVSKNARGKGVFQKMLNYADTIREKYKIDFLMGFPVEASYKSFISNGWNNPFDLNWYMKIKNPLGFLFSWLYKNDNHISLDDQMNSAHYRMENQRSFLDWRQNFQHGKYRVFTFREGQNTFEVNHKVNRRKKIFNELIIGEILVNNSDESFIARAFKKYYRWLFFQFDMAILSFCTNNEKESMNRMVIDYGLKKIENKVYFITKYAEQMNSAEWLLYRSDIDTW
jgi:hypothetical protein